MTTTFMDGLLCDGIRREDSGKLLIVGAYTNSVLFGEFPAVAQFSLLAKIGFDGPGTHEINLRVRLGDTEAHLIDGTIESAAEGQTWAPIPMAPLEVLGPTTLVVEQRRSVPDGWYRVFEIPIDRRGAGP